MEKYKEEIKKEANEYSKSINNGIWNNQLYSGFLDGVNSKISERIKIDFAIECLQDILFETERFISDHVEEMILKKITELKNKRDGK